MRLVADENVDRQIVDRLRAHGHDVLSIAEVEPGIDDDVVLLKARESGALLLTGDKDFGELVFRRRLLSSDVVLMRLIGLTPDQKADIVVAAFELHGTKSPAHFAVLSRRNIRIRSVQLESPA